MYGFRGGACEGIHQLVFLPSHVCLSQIHIALSIQIDVESLIHIALWLYNKYRHYTYIIIWILPSKTQKIYLRHEVVVFPHLVHIPPLFYKQKQTIGDNLYRMWITLIKKKKQFIYIFFMDGVGLALITIYKLVSIKA